MGGIKNYEPQSRAQLFGIMTSASKSPKQTKFGGMFRPVQLTVLRPLPTSPGTRAHPIARPLNTVMGTDFDVHVNVPALSPIELYPSS